MNSALRWVKRNKVKTGIVTAAGAFGLGFWWLNSQKLPFHYEAGNVQSPAWTLNPLPSRSAQLQALEGTKEFDVLVIGGGATGCGVALDSITRGLSTALVEKYDISSGTSSRSTKLIHGGVRYLQKAIMNLDYGQYLLVKEALHERANLLQIAPHLSAPLPIMLPVYTWWQVPYFWAGIKVYDWVSGRKCVKPSFVLTKNNALEKFPMLKQDKLKAAIVYYDGQHNDARMNLAIALTAVRQGCCMATHTEVLKLLTKQDGEGKEKVCGATLRDNMTGKVFDVRAKCVINATGPFTDGVRQMGDKDVKKICQPSAGVHIILPDYYSPESMGLLDPATSDGRIIFFLPWQGLTIAGTTDSPSDVTHHPAPTEDDIQFILKEVKNYLSPEVHVRRGDVQAAWSGIRPLVIDPNSKNTQSICRNHVVEVSANGLITIAGGKWTTYRSMAVDAMDTAVKQCGLNQSQPSGTDGLILDGGYQWTPNHYIKLAQDYGLETDVAKHLSGTYGDQAENVARLAKVTGKRWPVVGKRLVEDFPYIEAEVKYAIYEYACTAVDVLARRTRLSFLNVHAAEEALPQILSIMQRELGWSKERVAQEKKDALELLYNEMGKKAREGVMSTGITLSALDIERYKNRFNKVDQGRKGFITRIDLQNLLEDMNEGLDDDTLNDMLDEVDLNKNGKVELDEFLELMSNVRSGTISGNRLATLLKMGENKPVKITVDRSGGGV